MGLATSLVIFAVGAILRFATTVHTSSFNVHTIGLILMVVGAVGFLTSVIFWASWGGYGMPRRRTTYRSTDGTVVEDRRDVIR
jgi:hypothetical protein